MALEFSPTVVGSPMDLNAGFNAASLDFSGCADFANPVLHIDHYRMSEVTFAPHPHAGFSAVSYIFDDSPGKIRNRDSLGHDFVVGPGGMVWTQAGRGVVHDELPDAIGQTVHGLQIFINLSAANKDRAPEVFNLASGDCPIVEDSGGTRVKIVSGAYGGQEMAFGLAEQIDLLDVTLGGEWDYAVSERRHTVFYVAQGALKFKSSVDERILGSNQAVAVRGDGLLHFVRAEEPCRLVILSGAELHEPIAKYGPFVMNREEELQAVVTRYQRGEMGVLAPLG